MGKPIFQREPRRPRAAVIARVVALLLAATVTAPSAERVSDIANTPHNLSSTQTENTVHSAGGNATDEICVFCHTPHGASTAGGFATPLWNRELSSETYTPYYSASIDAYAQGDEPQPTGNSKLCLSCHDGTIALGQVTNAPGSGTGSELTMTTDGGATSGTGRTMPAGDGETSGFTRRLGTDLTNDHPISFTYDAGLADRDGELYAPRGTSPSEATAVDRIAVRAPGVKPAVPLYEDVAGDGEPKLQCTTCHDPHLRDDALAYSIKFLRLNRFQQATSPTDGNFSEGNDILCLACHDKVGWGNSAHARSDTAEEAYADEAAARREFFSGIRVWEAACLNCHDTHAVQGTRRLLREGVSGSGGPTFGGSGTGAFMTGFAVADNASRSAIEQTCYQCHRRRGEALDGSSVADVQGVLDTSLGSGVPNIKDDFALANHMPITSSEQRNGGSESHDIDSAAEDPAADYPVDHSVSALDCDTDDDGRGDAQCAADFIEERETLGYGSSTGSSGNTRHAECTDCHNPHRVTQSACFNGALDAGCTTGVGNWSQPANGGTHAHESGHRNIASGVLRGIWGVEPCWGTTSPSHSSTSCQSDQGRDTRKVMFYEVPDAFVVKRGNPAGSSTALSSGYLTREYQVCLKCHSNYAYRDVDLHDYDMNGTLFEGGDPCDGATEDCRHWNSNAFADSQRPALGAPGTSAGTGNTDRDNFDYYTNQAREFAPFDSTGVHGSGECNTGADGSRCDNNHRSWHPVLGATGRSLGDRGISNGDNAWNAPWDDANVGSQTMYCTDCHGSDVSSGTSVVPDGGEPAGGDVWGPHGSSNRFLLKGTYAGSGSSRRDLCFKCHRAAVYNSRNPCDGDPGCSGFNDNGDRGNLHAYHVDKIGSLNCNWCHVAVPHGWKNKALLVNLDDVGPEAGRAPGTQVSGPFTEGPYYYNAMVEITSFATSGNWSDSNCRGVDWMKSNCSSPP